MRSGRGRPKWTLALAAGAVGLAGCGGAGQPAAAPAPATATATATAMSPGMVMPDGSTMGAGPSTSPPPALAVMVCGDEVRGDLMEVLSLSSTPATAATWVDHLYTCTYQLPVGPLVLSVKESADAGAAQAYYTAARSRLKSTVDTDGLGRYAYRTPTGTVGLVKDQFTLTVDATGLPARFGSQGQKRTDLAYEVASVVLGCWTGDDD
jgi:hypothetical protein